MDAQTQVPDGDRPGRLARWMYRGGRPHRLVRAINAGYAWAFAQRWMPLDQAATLEVRGRTSGRAIQLPVVALAFGGERYLVSMLGEASWVKNVRAAQGVAVLLVRGRRLKVRLVEVPAAERPPILRAYLQVAPGARPHIQVDRSAPVADFEPIAAQYPTFRITPRR